MTLNLRASSYLNLKNKNAFIQHLASADILPVNKEIYLSETNVARITKCFGPIPVSLTHSVVLYDLQPGMSHLPLLYKNKYIENQS